MSILRDIMDTVRDLDTAGNVDEYFRKKKYSSISKRSNEGTLQFPVLVSRSLDVETLQMVTKALERQYSSFVQIVLTMSPFLDVDKQKDPIGYLRQFHQNSDVKTDLKDVMNFGGDVLQDNYNCYTNENETKVLFAGTFEGSTGNLVADNKEQLKSVLEHVRTDKLNDRCIPKNNFIYKFSNDELSARHNQVLTEADKTGSDDGDSQKSYPVKPKDKDIKINDKVLTDNDVKKSNELVPTTLHLRLKLTNKETDDLGFLDFIIGVKATMHPIKSDEMVSNLVAACQNNKKFFNFIRWTTGEINFFKDLVFNIREIKDDVVNRSTGASPWWISLKRRKAHAKMKNALMLPNQILPNTSIVISMEEVEYIKSQYGFDLMDPVFVDKIMQTYFLLGFVVVDNSTQITHFMFDGQKNFQSVTFTGLERENSNKANDFKEMLKLINRI